MLMVPRSGPHGKMMGSKLGCSEEIDTPEHAHIMAH